MGGAVIDHDIAGLLFGDIDVPGPGIDGNRRRLRRQLDGAQDSARGGINDRLSAVRAYETEKGF